MGVCKLIVLESSVVHPLRSVSLLTSAADRVYNSVGCLLSCAIKNLSSKNCADHTPLGVQVYHTRSNVFTVCGGNLFPSAVWYLKALSRLSNIPHFVTRDAPNLMADPVGVATQG